MPETSTVTVTGTRSEAQATLGGDRPIVEEVIVVGGVAGVVDAAGSDGGQVSNLEWEGQVAALSVAPQLGVASGSASRGPSLQGFKVRVESRFHLRGH